jgi:hypothetical protein
MRREARLAQMLTSMRALLVSFVFAGAVACGGEASAPIEAEEEVACYPEVEDCDGDVLSTVPLYPNTSIASGCTCNSTYHKIFCPRGDGTWYTYCSYCCGY